MGCQNENDLKIDGGGLISLDFLEIFGFFWTYPTHARKCLLYYAHTRTTIHARTRTYSSFFLQRVTDQIHTKLNNPSNGAGYVDTWRQYVDFMTTFLGNIPANIRLYKDLCRNVNVNPIYSLYVFIYILFFF